MKKKYINAKGRKCMCVLCVFLSVQSVFSVSSVSEMRTENKSIGDIEFLVICLELHGLAVVFHLFFFVLCRVAYVFFFTYIDCYIIRYTS